MIRIRRVRESDIQVLLNKYTAEDLKASDSEEDAGQGARRPLSHGAVSLRTVKVTTYDQGNDALKSAGRLLTPTLNGDSVSAGEVTNVSRKTCGLPPLIVHDIIYIVLSLNIRHTVHGSGTRALAPTSSS
eukprot:g37233.t1